MEKKNPRDVTLNEQYLFLPKQPFWHNLDAVSALKIGRFHSISPELRLCKFCASNDIVDESYFLLINTLCKI